MVRGDESALGLIGDVEQDSAMLASEDNDFLIRMGISRKLLTDIMYQQKAVAAGSGDKSTRRCLTDAEADALLELLRRERVSIFYARDPAEFGTIEGN